MGAAKSVFPVSNRFVLGAMFMRGTTIHKIMVFCSGRLRGVRVRDSPVHRVTEASAALQTHYRRTHAWPNAYTDADACTHAHVHTLNHLLFERTDQQL